MSLKGIRFPPTFTAEENALRMKYVKLRLIKKKLEKPHKDDSISSNFYVRKEKSSTSQEQAKEVAKMVMMSSQGGSSKSASEKTTTKDFKKPSRQSNAALQKRRAIKTYGGDSRQDCSVIVKAASITPKFINKHFRQIDHIQNVKFQEQSAIVTFDTESGAKYAVGNLDGAIVDGVILEVSLVKKKNYAWTASALDAAAMERRKPEHAVFVQLQEPIAREELHDLFKSSIGFNHILEPPKSKKYGMVTFKTEEAADKAVTQLSGKMFKGLPLVLGRPKLKESYYAKGPCHCESSGTPDPRDLIQYE